MSERDAGTAWSCNPWRLRGGVTERGTTGAGRPQITGVPGVHRFLKLGTTLDDLRFGQTGFGDKGIRSLTPPVVIHGSMLGNGPKFFLVGRSRGLVGGWLVGPPRRRNRRTVSRWALETAILKLVPCKGQFPCIKNSQGCSLPN